MTEENTTTATEEKSETKQHTGPSLTTIVIGILILVFSGAFAKAIVDSPKPWKTYTVGTIAPRITLAAPSEPKLLNVEIPEALSKISKRIEYYECSSEPDGIIIQVLGITYNPEINLSLQGGINGAVGDVAHLSGASNVQHSTEPITISGKNATLLTITADVNGSKFEQKTVFLVNGQSLKQINFQYESTDVTGRKSAQKALESLQVAG
jgi:hypothetical protein